MSICFAHVSTRRLENCIHNVNGLHVALIHMKMWIPLMAMLRSLKFFIDMQFSIYNDVP